MEPAQLPRSEETEQAKKAWKDEMVEGEVWAVVDAKWLSSWLDYVGLTTNFEPIPDAAEKPRPGEIDNSRIVDANSKELQLVRRDVIENRDYQFVPLALWRLLKSWYGGGPELLRDVIMGADNTARISLHPAMVSYIEADPETGKFDNNAPRHVVRLPKDKKMCDVLDKLSPRAPAEKEKEEKGNEGKDEDGKDNEGAKEVERDVRLWYLDLVDNAPSVIPQPGPGYDNEGKDNNNEAPWRLFTPSLLAKHVDTFLDTHVKIIAVERRREDGTWVRKPRELTEFMIGDVVDAIDTQMKWFWSDVIEIAPGKVKIHYHGWTTKWDCWFSQAQWEDSIAVKGSRATGGKNSLPSRPAYQSNYNSNYSSSSYSSNDYYYGGGGYYKSQKGKPMVRGGVGLSNLGNTCFMNSTLQCLSHTQPLREVFLSRRYAAKINRDNPLGCKGRMAEEFGALMQEMWGNEYAVVSPSGFKEVIGKFQPRFMGYQQHDSSELLGFLIDGLLEDLNEIIKKPVTPSVESNGRPDAVVAAEAWQAHRRRNLSMLDPLLEGQLKSTVVCPDCPRVSVTFDPFVFLSVPLPQEMNQVQIVHVAFLNGRLMRFRLLVSKAGSMYDLKKSLSAMCGLAVECMSIADVWSNRVYRFLDDQNIAALLNNDVVFVFELPKTDGDGRPFPKDGWFPVQIVQQYREAGNIGKSFGCPMVVPIHKQMTRAAVGRSIREIMQNCAKPGAQMAIHTSSRNLGHIIDKANEFVEDEKQMDFRMDMYQPKTADLSFVCLWQDPSQYNQETMSLEKEELHESCRAGEGPRQAGVVTLDDCLREFSKQEKLDKNNEWYCSACKGFKEATKKIDIWRTPEIVIIHMKRFIYTRNWRDKISTFVDFPLKGLDLDPYIVDPANRGNVYDLYAISNHMGNLGGGHYTAYCLNSEDGKWYSHNDSSVRGVSANEVVSSDAYVLFYQRRAGPPKEE